jgi:ABC-type amino acid transport substrate-binding protein
MTKNKINFILLFLSVFFIMVFPMFFLSAQNKNLLNSEETLWLASRNNTIVVYPEKSFAPFSYQSNSGIPLGLSIDYIELVAKKIGAKVEYLPSKSLNQILDDVKTGKGDIVTSLIDAPEKQEYLYFTDSYADISSVIVVRRDSNIKNGITLNDLQAQRVAVTSGRAIEHFISKNYPRVIIEPVTDDEVGLQQLVLGEVDAAVMDIASLSFYLSKQVLSSVKIVGNAGFNYNLSFGVPKDKQILQSILDKGLTQISKNERSILHEKWIVVPEEQPRSLIAIFSNTFNSEIIKYTFFLLFIFVLFLIFNKKNSYHRFMTKKADIKEIKNEISELEEMNQSLTEELIHIKEAEEKLKEKLDSIEHNH